MLSNSPWTRRLAAVLCASLVSCLYRHEVDNIAEIAAAGADTFVSGSGIFGCGQAGDPNGYDGILRQMRAQLETVGSV